MAGAMTDLPPDVRHRAAQAAENAFVKEQRQSGSPDWAVVVDAVAEVLAAEQPIKAEFYADEDEDEVVFMELDDDEYDRSKVQADPQKIRPIGADHIIAEIDALKARVDLLTAALTEIGHNVCDDYDSNNYDSCEVAGRDRDEWCAACIARAVLSAGEEKSGA